MEFTLTPAEAQVLYVFLASVLVPFVVSFLSKEQTRSKTKLAIALAVSLLGGLASEYASGAIDLGKPDVMSIVTAGAAVFTASQAHFSTWFTALGYDANLLSVGSKPAIVVNLEEKDT